MEDQLYCVNKFISYFKEHHGVFLARVNLDKVYQLDVAQEAALMSEFYQYQRGNIDFEKKPKSNKKPHSVDFLNISNKEWAKLSKPTQKELESLANVKYSKN